jgi:hypothetical protein
MMEGIHQMPLSAWRRIGPHGVSCRYKTPRILDPKITLKDYHSSLREIVVADLGQEDPPLLLTNQLIPLGLQIDRTLRPKDDE